MAMAALIIFGCIVICTTAFFEVVIVDAKTKKVSTKYRFILICTISFLEFLEFTCCSLLYGLQSVTIVHAVATVIWTAVMVKISFHMGKEKTEKIQKRSD